MTKLETKKIQKIKKWSKKKKKSAFNLKRAVKKSPFAYPNWKEETIESEVLKVPKHLKDAFEKCRKMVDSRSTKNAFQVSKNMGIENILPIRTLIFDVPVLYDQEHAFFPYFYDKKKIKKMKTLEIRKALKQFKGSTRKVTWRYPIYSSEGSIVSYTTNQEKHENSIENCSENCGDSYDRAFDNKIDIPTGYSPVYIFSSSKGKYLCQSEVTESRSPADDEDITMSLETHVFYYDKSQKLSQFYSYLYNSVGDSSSLAISNGDIAHFISKEAGTLS